MFGEQTFAQLRTGLKPYPSLPPSLISLMVSGDVKHHETGSGGDLASAKQLLYSATCSFASCAEQSHKDREPQSGQPAVELPEAKDRPTHYESSELKCCVKVEVVVLGSPSLIVLTVSVDVKQHWYWAMRAPHPCLHTVPWLWRVRRRHTDRRTYLCVDRRRSGMSQCQIPSTGLRHPSFNHCRI